MKYPTIHRVPMPVHCVRLRRFLESDQQGFTLVEWMVGLAIMAILSSIAAPGLSGFLQRGGVDSAASALVRSLTQSRGLAIQQGRTLTLSINRTLTSGACGGTSVAVAWALQGSSTDTLECLSNTDLQARYGVSLTASASTVRFNANGLADNTSAVDVTFSRGSKSAVVRIYAGGTARVL